MREKQTHTQQESVKRLCGSHVTPRSSSFRLQARSYIGVKVVGVVVYRVYIREERLLRPEIKFANAVIWECERMGWRGDSAIDHHQARKVLRNRSYWKCILADPWRKAPIAFSTVQHTHTHTHTHLYANIPSWSRKPCTLLFLKKS